MSDMDERTSSTGLVISTLGGMATFVSVFLSWYGVGFTQAAVDFADSAIGRVFPQFVGSSYETQLRQVGSAMAGHPVFGLTAQHALTNTSKVLMVVGAVAVAVSLLSLASGRVPAQARSALAIAGLGTAGLVAWRMLDNPNPAPQLLTMSLKGGAYLALVGTLAIAAGAMWPRPAASSPSRASEGADVWGELSGWTPSG